MKKGANDQERLQHILEAVIFIKKYTEEETEDSFLRNELLKYAVLKQMEIIGEAAYYLSDDVKKAYREGEIEWDKIIGARHIYVHHYFQVNWLIVWDIVSGDIPGLEQQIQNIINDFKE